MSDLKPIGSEKLQGQDKLKRIMEIARFRENLPNNLNETSKKEFDIELSDGNQYQIVREKLGYIIKRTISESETEYIEPMKNRKYYSSYSQALKRLNLLTKEVNRLTENEEGTSLFGEQKKFVLKTPKPEAGAADEMPAPPPPPAEPPAVPQPDLPPSPEMGAPAPETGGMPAETPAPETDEMPDEAPSAEGGEPKGEMVSFRMIQKLTGKLTQKIREFENEKGLTSENIKYVVNMVLSAVDLSALSDEDREDIMSKIEGTEEDMDMGMEDMGPEEDMGMEDMGGEEMAPEGEPVEKASKYGAIIDSIFGESKVDKVISKYFTISEGEKKLKNRQKFIREVEKKRILENKMSKVIGLCETIEQELGSKKFLKENPNFVLVGKTNKNNLVFESSNKQVKISTEGKLI
jgi:hypothetical protein